MEKILNVGIFAHIDAGKTSLTERLLYLSGALRTQGSIERKNTATDFLSVEKRRGISVRDASVSLNFRDTRINLIDTPGHADFFEETELALTAVDVAIVVVSAVEGLQAQTEALLKAISRRNLPALFFINKCDRAGAKPDLIFTQLANSVNRELLPFNRVQGEGDGVFAIENPDLTEDMISASGDEGLLEEYLLGELDSDALFGRMRRLCSSAAVSPVLFGSAKTGVGCDRIFCVLTELFSFDRTDLPFSAFVYQVEHKKAFGKVAHVRVFGGTLHPREDVLNRRSQKLTKITQLKFIQSDRYTDAAELKSGDVGAIVGLSDVRAGDILGELPPVEVFKLSQPYLRVKISPDADENLPVLKNALEMLSDESPSLAAEWIPEKRELNVNTVGTVQTEVLKEQLAERFGLDVTIGKPSVIFKETPSRSGFGFEYYTMPKPCWAVVRFLIEPLETGSGLVYESTVSEKKIAYRYQEHVKTAVPRALEQGLHGWEVTDLKITLIDGEDHPQHTHPLDFFVATPMGIMDGLRNVGTTLLEPVLNVRIVAPESVMGKVVAEVSPRRANLLPIETTDGYFTLNAEVPAMEAFDLSEKIASASGGRAVYSATLKGYFPCPDEYRQERERVGINPLDRAKWILHARNAL